MPILDFHGLFLYDYIILVSKSLSETMGSLDQVEIGREGLRRYA